MEKIYFRSCYVCLVSYNALHMCLMRIAFYWAVRSFVHSAIYSAIFDKTTIMWLFFSRINHTFELFMQFTQTYLWCYYEFDASKLRSFLFQWVTLISILKEIQNCKQIIILIKCREYTFLNEIWRPSLGFFLFSQ